MSQNNEQNIDSQIEKKLPDYMILYPEFEPIKEQKKLKTKKTINFKNNEEEDDDKYEINEIFLEVILKKPFSFGRNKLINTISKNIQTSKLFKKLLTDYRSEKKINSANICNLFAQNLNYSKLEEKNILYRIGENDNRLFYILSGRIQVLKMKEIPFVKMTNIEYLNYCKYLYKLKEIYLLNEVINSNTKILPFISEEDVVLVSKINFMSELIEKIKKHMIPNNFALHKFFNLYEYSYDDFKIKISEINNLEQKVFKKMQGAVKEWEDYLIEKCSPTESEYHFYEPFGNLLKSRQIKFINCFAYENESYLEPGDYFGDISYDSQIIPNKYTIRAQKDSVLAWIKNNDYLNIIDPKRKMEKFKELSFLHNYFFFKEISINSFEKNYYEQFSVHELTRGTVLYTTGDKPKNLIFLKEGKLSLEIKCTIIDLFFLIRDLFSNLMSSPIYNDLPSFRKKILLSKETINLLKKAAYDDRLRKIIRYNPLFFEELKKVKTFQISEINGYEIVGIEEIFLNTPYIMKSTVNDKKALCYGLPTKNISRIIKEGHELLFSFVQTSINKIITLIKRLDTIKNNSYNFAKMKFDYDLKINQMEVLEGNENNDSNIVYNLPKIKNPNTLYDNYTNNKKNIKTEIDESHNNTNNIVSFDKSELNSNTNNSFCRTKSPVKKSTLYNNNLKDIMILHKKTNKANNFSHSSSKNYSLNDGNAINKQSLFKVVNLKKNIGGTNSNKKNDENKNENEFNKDSNTNTKNLFYDSNNKKENILLLGKNTINIDNIKKNIDEFLSCDNSDKYVEIIQSNKINNNFINNFYNHNIPNRNGYAERTNLFKRKNFHLSLVPLNKLNIYTDNNKSLEEKIYTNTFYEHANNDINSITDFVGVNSVDNNYLTQKNNSNSLLPKINYKFGLKSYSSNNKKINKYNQNNLKNENNFTKLMKKDVGKDMVKEYYNDIKMNGYSSFIPNKQVNTIFMRKFNQKYKDAIKNKKFKK